MKTFLVLLLILSLFFYLTGCYSVSEMSKDEFKEKNKKGSATITTKNNETYQFEKGWYHIDSDTLYGTGAKMHGEYKVPFSDKIAIDDISEFKAETPDGVKTFTLIIGVAAAALLVIYAIAAASFSYRVITD